MERIGKVAGGLERQEVLVGVAVSGWGEAVLAMVMEHVLGVAGSEAAGMGSQVEKDGIELPVTQCMDGSLVDARYEEGCGST